MNCFCHTFKNYQNKCSSRFKIETINVKFFINITTVEYNNIYNTVK